MEQPYRPEAVVKLFDLLERAMGIEPTSEAWEASILPLYDARSYRQQVDYTQHHDWQYRPSDFHIFTKSIC
jgi:hypothetical protein